MLSFETLLTIAFIVVLAVLIIIDRKNIELKYIMILRRTERGKEWIYRVGRRYKRIFVIYGTIAIAVCIAASLYVFYFVFRSSWETIIRPEKVGPSVGLVLPQVPGVSYPFPYVLGVPLLYWIIAILTIMFAHELSHAFVARAENIELKSFGAFLLLIFPGAFVEPDEAQLKRGRPLTRLRIYTAGTFGNFLFALSILIIVLGFAQLNSYVFTSQGVVFQTLPNTPAARAELSGTILSINDKTTDTIYDLMIAMREVEPGERVKIATTTGTYRIVTTQNPGDPQLAYIGIKFTGNRIAYTGSFSFLGQPPSFLIRSLEWLLGWPLFSPIQLGLFNWLFWLNFLVGLFNILPMKPLDGGLMFETLFGLISKKNAKIIANCLSVFTVFVLLIPILVPIILK